MPTPFIRYVHLSLPSFSPTFSIILFSFPYPVILSVLFNIHSPLVTFPYNNFRPILSYFLYHVLLYHSRLLSTYIVCFRKFFTGSYCYFRGLVVDCLSMGRVSTSKVESYITKVTDLIDCTYMYIFESILIMNSTRVFIYLIQNSNSINL